MAQRAYFGLGFVPSLIIAILPIISWIFGIIICFQREQYGFAILRIFLGWCPVFWIMDIICLCVHKDLIWLA
ncbi:MAG: hypothetical protein J5598_00930 [Clostridia bacterium]|nr:hypothetical protein [Clostridia bacterium]